MSDLRLIAEASEDWANKYNEYAKGSEDTKIEDHAIALSFAICMANILNLSERISQLEEEIKKLKEG